MIGVKNTFEQRKIEIDKYFKFLQSYKSACVDDDGDLFKILKSNLLIMLYNLIESSISNAIEEIHNNIYSNSVSFNSLKGKIKSLIIINTRRNNPDDFVKKVNDIATDIIKHSYNKEIKKKLFNGNINRDKINSIGEQYGFKSNTDYKKTGRGKYLDEIKNQRNDLAHGEYSFAEVGKEYTIEALEKMKDETINYIDEILANIELYLQNKNYLS